MLIGYCCLRLARLGYTAAYLHRLHRIKIRWTTDARMLSVSSRKSAPRNYAENTWYKESTYESDNILFSLSEDIGLKILSIRDLNRKYQYVRAFVGSILCFKTFIFTCFRIYFFNILIYLTKHVEKNMRSVLLCACGWFTGFFKRHSFMKNSI